MFTLMQILENSHEFQVDTHHLFVDFKQTNDAPNRDELFPAMNEFGIPRTLVKLCQMAPSNSMFKSRWDNYQEVPNCQIFKTQGDALSYIASSAFC